MQDRQGRVVLRRRVHERKITGDVVRADGFEQTGERPAGRLGLLLQLARSLNDRSKIGVGINGPALKFLDQIARRWRIDFPKRPHHHKHHQHRFPNVLAFHAENTLCLV